MNASWKKSFSISISLKRTALIAYLLLFGIGIAFGQTIIFSGGGNSYTGSDAVTTDSYTGIDVSACTSLEVTMDYSFSLPWMNSGNMESSDECPFGTTPCSGNPFAQEDGCLNCWDFLVADFAVDGSSIGGDLIGEAGTTDAEQFGTISSGIICNTGSTMTITVNTQTWANNETVSFSNIMVMCWEGAPMASATSPICEGETVDLFSGVIDASVVNSYSWSSDGGASISNSSSANTSASGATNGETFTITTTDVNNCPGTDMVTVTVNPIPLVTITGPTSLCNGQTGTLSATGTGTSFTWSTGDNTQDITITGPGTYDVTVSDGGTCTAEDSFTVTGGSGPTVSITGADFCEGSSTNLTADALPAGPAYTYDWSNSGSGSVITVTTGGTYTVTVTDPSNGCTATSSITISTIPVPTVSISGPSNICTGDTETLTASGSAGVSYLWSTGATTSDINITSGGTFDVTVTDASGNCTASASVSVTEIPSPTVSINGALDFCTGDSEILTASGSPGVTFLWSTGATSTDITVTTGGTYDVTVTDASGSCTASASWTINEIPSPSVSISGPASLCPGETTTLSASATPSTVSYLWGNGETTADITVGGPGTYSVTVTDPTGTCTASDDLTITSSPVPNILIDVSPSTNACIGQPTVLTELGGDATTWSWAGPNGPLSGSQAVTIFPSSAADAGLYSVTISDAGGCTAVGAVNISIAPAISVTASITPDPVCEGATATLSASSSGAPAINFGWLGPNGILGLGQNIPIGPVTSADEGVYAVGVLSIDGCVDTSFVTLTLAPPVNLSLSAAPNPICEGETLVLSENGNEANTWNWTGSNGFSSTDQSPVINNISGPGPIQFDVEGSINGGCINTASISVDVSAPPIIDLIASNNPACAGSDVSLIEQGGQAVQWDWTGPNGFVSTDQAPTITGVTDLDAGTYTVVVTDANGCTNTDFIDLVVDITPVNVSISFEPDPICEGEEITISENGGEGVSWFWNGPNGFNDIGSSVTIPNASSANSGVYIVIVTDANGCTEEADVFIDVSPIPSVLAVVANSACSGNDVQLDEIGQEALQWLWEGPDGFSSVDQSPILSNAGPENEGTYSVTITDANGCTAESSVELVLGGAITIQASASVDTTCENSQFDLIGSGTDIIDWRWTGPNNYVDSVQNPSISDASVSSSGFYVLRATNNDGCEGIDSIEVIISPQPDFSGPVSQNTCDSLILSAITGTDLNDPTFWTAPDGPNGSGTQIPVGSAIRQTSRIYLYDNNAGCVRNDSILITITESPDPGTTRDTTLCLNESVDLSSLLNGADQGGVFVNDQGLPVNPIYTESNPGTYQLYYRLTGTAPCSNDSSGLRITFESIEDLTITSTQDTVCVGETIVLSAQGTGVVSYTWTDPQGNTQSGNTLNITNAQITDRGNYRVVATSNNACSAEENIDLWISEAPDLDPISINPACDSIVLPEITGSNLSNPGYFTSLNPLSNRIASGSVISQSQRLYVVDEIIGCQSIDSIDIIIEQSPNSGIGRDTIICGGSSVDITTLITSADAGGIYTNLDAAAGYNFPNFNTSIASPGAYRFSYEVNGAGICPTAQTIITITVTQAPSAGIGRDSSVCLGSPVQLFGLLSNADPGGTWININGATGLNSNTGEWNSSGNNPGAYSFAYAVGGGDCPLDEVTININLFPALTAGNGRDTTICEGQSIDLFSLLMGADLAGSFEDLSTSGGLNNSTFNSAGLLPNTYTIAYIIGGADCPEDRTEINISVELPANSGEARDSLLCQGQSVNLFDLLEDEDPNGAWTNLDGATNFNGTTGFFNSTGNPSGTYSFEYSVGANTICGPASSTVTITISNAPSAGSALPGTVCQGETIDLFDFLDNEDGGGTFLDISATGGLSGSNFNSQNTTPGIYEFVYQVGGGDCPMDTETITISVLDAPFAGIGRDTIICQGESIELFDLLIGADLSGSFDDQSASGGLNNTTFSSFGLAPGNYIITYVVGGTNCPDDSAEINVFIELPANSGEARDSLLCQGQSVNLFDLLRNEDPNGTWTNLDGASDFNETIGFFNTSANPSGGYRFEYSVGANTICGPSSSLVTITISTAPSAGMASPGTICQGESINLFDLLDNEDGGGTFQDLNVTGGLSGSNFNSQNIAPGTYEFRYEVGGGDCPMDAETISVTVSEAPSAGIGRDTTICQGGLINIFDLISGEDTGGTLATNSGASNFDPNTGDFGTGTNLDGSYQFTYTVGGGNCPVSNAVVVVVITSAPSAGTATDTTICQGQSIDLFELLSNEDNGGNFTDLSGTSGLSGSTFNSTGVFVGVVSLRYTVGGGDCPIDTEDIIINIETAPNAGTPRDTTLCQGNEVNIFDLITGADTGGTIANVDGASDFDPSSGLWVTVNNPVGNYSFIYTVGGGDCPSVSSTVSVRLTSAPSAGEASSSTLCEGQTIDLFDLLSNEDPGGVFTDLDNTSGLTNSTFNSAGLSAGDYRFLYTVGGGDCPQDESTITINITDAPNAGLGRDTILCQGVIIDLTTLLSNADPGGRFEDTDDSGGLTGSILNTTFFIPDGPSFQFDYVVGDGINCPEDRTSIVITIFESVSAGIGRDTFLCGEQIVDLSTLLTGADVGGQYFERFNNNSPTTSLFNTQGLPSQSYEFLYVVPNSNGCAPDSTTITVDLLSAPFAGNPRDTVVCSDSPVNLNDLLSGEDLGGQFFDLGSSGQLLGTLFFNNNASAGDYPFLYVVGDGINCPFDSSEITITVVLEPNAGQDNSALACTGESLDLNSLIQGGDPNGVFSDASSGQTIGEIFETDNLPAGTYRVNYTIPGGFNCPSDQAEFIITVIASPQAGQDSSLIVCDGSAYNLLDLLRGADVGGRFVNNAGLPVSNIFNTNGLPPNTYQINYIAGDGLVCNPDTSVILITISQGPEAGSARDTSVCLGAEIDLFSLISGGDPGGIFVSENLDTLATNWNTTGQAIGALRIRYIVGDNISCPSDEISFTVRFEDGLSAGSGIVGRICQGENLNLFTLLLSADRGGLFIEQTSTGQLTDSLFNTTGLPAGRYGFTYQVGAGSECPIDESTITVFIEEPREAGLDTLITLCGTETIDLNLLIREADPGGIFSTSSGQLPGGTFDPSGLADGTYSITYEIPATATCPADQAMITILLSSAPSPGLDNQTTICLGESISLSDLLRNADPGGDFVEEDNTGQLMGDVFNSLGLSPGNYRFSYIVGDGINCPLADALFTIIVVDAPEVVNLVENCDPISQTFTVSFEIQGGTGQGYTVNGTSITGTTYTSPTFNSGETYQIAVSDLNACDTILLEGTVSCACETEAGDLSTTVSVACFDQTINLDHINFQLRMGDVLRYLIYDMDPSAGGQVISQQNSPSLSLLSPLVTGQTYFVQAAVGRESNGLLDLNDPCLDLSNLVEIRFEDPLTAKLDVSPEICPGDNASLTIIVDGSGPFTIVYSDGLQNDTLFTASDTTEIAVNPSFTTSYSILSVESANNPCNTILPTQSSTILVQPLDINIQAQSSFNGYDIQCPDSEDAILTVSALSGASPFNFNWSNGEVGQTIAGLGAGTYLVTVTDNTGCSTITQYQVTAPPGTRYELQSAGPNCPGGENGFLVIGNVNGNGPFDLTINDDFLGPIFNGGIDLPNIPSGNYALTIEDVNGCITDTLISIPEPAPLVLDLNLPQNVEYRPGDSILLNPIVNFIPQLILWNTDGGILTCDTCPNPVLYPLNDGIIRLVLENESGCRIEDAFTYDVDAEEPFFIPNVFSPNSDGTNDVWMAFGRPNTSLTINSVKIFDRWGNQVFGAISPEPGNPTDWWDGTFQNEELNPAVFVYIMELQYIDGRTEFITGDLTLMR